MWYTTFVNAKCGFYYCADAEQVAADAISYYLGHGVYVTPLTYPFKHLCTLTNSSMGRGPASLANKRVSWGGSVDVDFRDIYNGEILSWTTILIVGNEPALVNSLVSSTNLPVPMYAHTKISVTPLGLEILFDKNLSDLNRINYYRFYPLVTVYTSSIPAHRKALRKAFRSRDITKGR